MSDDVASCEKSWRAKIAYRQLSNKRRSLHHHPLYEFPCRRTKHAGLYACRKQLQYSAPCRLTQRVRAASGAGFVYFVRDRELVERAFSAPFFGVRLL